MSADDFMNFLKMRRNNISYGNIVSQASPTYAETPVGLASMELGVGDSKYDKRITNMQELDDLNEFRARQ